jgi:hypothetical protein
MAFIAVGRGPLAWLPARHLALFPSRNLSTAVGNRSRKREATRFLRASSSEHSTRSAGLVARLVVSPVELRLPP